MTKEETVEKFDEQLADLEVAGQQNSEVYSWIQFQKDQWLKGTTKKVRVVTEREKEVKRNGWMVHIEPTYEDKWEPAPITFGVFMNWKFKRLINTATKL